MSYEYRNIRVPENVYLRVKKVQARFSDKSMDEWPDSSQELHVDKRTNLVPMGAIVASGLEALEREFDAKERAKEKPAKPTRETDKSDGNELMMLTNAIVGSSTQPLPEQPSPSAPTPKRKKSIKP